MTVDLQWSWTDVHNWTVSRQSQSTTERTAAESVCYTAMYRWHAQPCCCCCCCCSELTGLMLRTTTHRTAPATAADPGVNEYRITPSYHTTRSAALARPWLATLMQTYGTSCCWCTVIDGRSLFSQSINQLIYSLTNKQILLQLGLPIVLTLWYTTAVLFSCGLGRIARICWCRTFVS